MLMPDHAKPQKKNYSGFVVIGAGLPRTGTMSLRAALGILLDGACHHMLDVFAGSNEVGRIQISKLFTGHLFGETTAPRP